MNEQTFLKQLINNERNSALFYSHLSALSKNNQIRNMLESIAVECGISSHRLIAYADIKHTKPDNSFGDIERNISLNKGIKWAIDVENESLVMLSEFRKRHGCYKKLYENKKVRLKKLESCEKLLK